MKLSKYYAKVNENVCVACGACAKECPKGAIQIWRGCYAVIEDKICVGCGKCSKICPTGCISKVEREEKK